MRISVLLLFFLLSACRLGSDTVQVRVIDGDTVEIMSGQHTGKRLRLVDINTPELRSTCPTDEQKQAERELALAAKARLETLTNRGVVLNLIMRRDGSDLSRDKYGRLLGSMQTPNGDDIAGIMIRERHGRFHRGSSRPESWC